jgi:uncharacterized SAM-binding protein YcdF (DUF218 family)
MRKWFAIMLSLMLGGIISSVILLWLASGEIYDYRDTFVLERDGSKIDVVLCLAGGKGRIPAAVDLWMKLKKDRSPNQVPVLFLSGVGLHANEETLMEQGIPKNIVRSLRKEDIVYENVSTNTFETAEIFTSFQRQQQWKHVLLVTAGYHMRRSSDILRKTVGPEVTIYSHTVASENFDRNGWHRDPYAVRVTMIEYIKWLFYRYSY